MKRNPLLPTALIFAMSLPAVALETVQRTTIAREHGAVELVMFFTTGCEPCREALLSWNRLVVGADELGLDVSFRAVSGELSEDIELFLEEQPIEGEVVSDPAIDLARAYGLRKLPSIIIVRPGQGAEILSAQALTLERLRTIVGEITDSPIQPVGHDHE